MARAQRFLISPLNSGQENDKEPWLISDNAFSELRNAFLFRGRVRKRFGSHLMNTTATTSIAQLNSRLRANIGTTGASPSTHDIPPLSSGTTLAIGQMFSIGNDMFTVFQIGAGVDTLPLVGAITAVIDTTVTPNTVTFTGAGVGIAVYWYPARPVMGLPSFEQDTVNEEMLIAFDTQFAYQFTGGAFERITTGGAAALWTGSDSQFFWATNYRGQNIYNSFIYVVNYNAADQISFYNGSTWARMNPIINGVGDTLESGRIIIPFKDRLVVLNTIEKIAGTDRTFGSRARFCQNGDPTDATNGWLESAGRGGYRDIPTGEFIISASLLKDRLIVYCERSSWELVYNGNKVLPFSWQQIDSELGAESTFSAVTFDKVVLGVGNVGIHACSGASVERIDQKIPDTVFAIHNEDDGPTRVYGIQDYFFEQVYWAFPSATNNRKFPQRVLVYNYEVGSWAFFDDSITAFGYFQKSDDRTWASMNSTWEQTNETWISPVLQSQFRDIVAGNQQGYIFVIDPGLGRNSPALQVTNISFDAVSATLTVVDHNLEVDDYIVVESVQGNTSINGVIARITDIDLPNDTLTVDIVGVGGTYTGAGTVARVSEMNIKTKQYNFFTQEAINTQVSRVDFYIDRTSKGEFTVDYFVSASSRSMLKESQLSGALLGTNIVETRPYTLFPLESSQARFWHYIRIFSSGENVQLRLYLSDAQMRNASIAWSEFQLNAMIFYASQGGPF